MKHNMSEFVKAARNRIGYTQEQMAKRLGVTKGAISGYENGRFEPTYDLVLEISRISGEPMPGTLPHQAVGTQKEEVNLHPVPIIGTMEGYDANYVIQSKNENLGFSTFFSRDWNAFALKIKGDSFAPRGKSGEIFIVEPGHPPQPGDSVLIVMKDGKRMVRELLFYRNGDYAFARQNENGNTHTIAADEIESIMYIAALMPRGSMIEESPDQESKTRYL